MGVLCLSQVDIFRLQSPVVNISDFKIVQSHGAIIVILAGACQYCLDRRGREKQTLGFHFPS